MKYKIDDKVIGSGHHSSSGEDLSGVEGVVLQIERNVICLVRFEFKRYKLKLWVTEEQLELATEPQPKYIEAEYPEKWPEWYNGKPVYCEVSDDEDFGESEKGFVSPAPFGGYLFFTGTSNGIFKDCDEGIEIFEYARPILKNHCPHCNQKIKEGCSHEYRLYITYSNEISHTLQNLSKCRKCGKIKEEMGK